MTPPTTPEPNTGTRRRQPGHHRPHRGGRCCRGGGGGIATYASVGAQFGYQTLFLMLLITVVLVVVQEMCARLGPYTGESLGALIREQFSLRVTAFALLAFLVSNLGLVVSEFAGIAAVLACLAV